MPYTVCLEPQTVNPSPYRTFLELLQPFPLTENLQLDENSLPACDQLARRHNVWMLFYTQLQRYEREVCQDECVCAYLAAHKAEYLQQIAMSMRQHEVGTETISLLKSGNIPALVIKGSAIAQEIYHNPNSRSSCDIDILVRRKDIEKIDSTLVRSGYTRMDQVPLGFLCYRLHHTTYSHNQSGFYLEIHWNLSIPGFFNLTSEQIWEEVVESETGALKFNPQMTLIMLLIHHHIHAFKQLRNTVDLYWAFHLYKNQIDWNNFSVKLHQIGLIKTALISINQIQELWKEVVVGLDHTFLLKEKMWEKRKVPSFILNYFLINLESADSGLTPKDLCYFRLALDKWPIIIFSFMKSFLPMPKVIKELYIGKENNIFINYFKFISWRLADSRNSLY